MIVIWVGFLPWEVTWLSTPFCEFLRSDLFLKFLNQTSNQKKNHHTTTRSTKWTNQCCFSVWMTCRLGPCCTVSHFIHDYTTCVWAFIQNDLSFRSSPPPSLHRAFGRLAAASKLCNFFKKQLKSCHLASSYNLLSSNYTDREEKESIGQWR